MSTSLNRWLEWDLNMFCMPSLTGEASQIYRSRHVAEYLDALAESNPSEREHYKVPIYETLFAMAANDDARAIEEVFRLCPWLDPHGYYHDDAFQTVLDVAMESSSCNAIAALVRCGVSPDYVQSGSGLLSSIFDYECDDEIVIMLASLGADPTLGGPFRALAHNEDDSDSFYQHTLSLVSKRLERISATELAN